MVFFLVGGGSIGYWGHSHHKLTHISTQQETKPAAEGLVHVAIDGGDLLASYTTPGQYVQVSTRRLI